MVSQALYITWLAGLLFILVSLYATRVLPPVSEGKEAIRTLKVTLFTVPEAFDGNVGAAQARAIQSWLRLSLDIQVVLLGRHASLAHFAQTTHHRVVVDSDLDFTFTGAALFNSILARARSSTSDVAALVDPQFILMREFVEALEHAHSFQQSWLMVAVARSIHVFPFNLEFRKGFWVSKDDRRVSDEQVLAHAKTHGIWTSCPDRYLWAWSTEDVPLHAGVMPSFVYGYNFHHQWLLNEALASGFRFVFDASDAITAFYSSEMESDAFSADGLRYPGNWTWIIDNNAHLAALYGSFGFRPSDFLNMPAKLILCGSRNGRVFQFLYPLFSTEPLAKDANPNLSSNHWNKSFLSSFRRFSRKTRYLCPSAEAKFRNQGNKSLKAKLMMGQWRVHCDCSNIMGEAMDCPASAMGRLPKILKLRSPIASMQEHMPTSLDSLLVDVASNDKTVVLSVVGNNYKDMLMNWVCRLRKLGVLNYVIGAVDTKVYEFGLLQGLPMFMTGPSLDLSFNDCHFGTECFKKVTKLKSRTVLQLLKQGYRVLFSDVDVYWFKNPLDYLASFGPGTIAAQSDQWNVTEAPNLPRRLNSGFYFAWPDSSTVAAFELIVNHASISNMSEQPSFYDVLCGEAGGHRVGDRRCLEPRTNVTTHFLERELFPNGAFNNMWDQKNVSEACRLQGCFVLHNNWVSGRHRKFARQIKSGLWDYDVTNRICLWRWLQPKPAHLSS